MKKNKNWNKKFKNKLDEKGLDSVSGGMFIAAELVEKLNQNKMVCAGTYEACNGNRGPINSLKNIK